MTPPKRGGLGWMVPVVLLLAIGGVIAWVVIRDNGGTTGDEVEQVLANHGIVCEEDLLHKVPLQRESLLEFLDDPASTGGVADHAAELRPVILHQPPGSRIIIHICGLDGPTPGWILKVNRQPVAVGVESNEADAVTDEIDDPDVEIVALDDAPIG